MKGVITALIISFLSCIGIEVKGQAADTLQLDETVFLAKTKSIVAARAKRDWKVSYFTYRGFKAGLRPNLSVSGMIPNYTQSFQEVIQPDGKINFRPIRYDNSYLSSQLNQALLPTGGNLFVQSDLQRYEDLINKEIQYNGLPIRIGIQQSLTGYNALKWEKRIAEMNYTESERKIARDLEVVAIEATLFFFDVLVAQTDVDIAKSNLISAEKLYTIAKEKLELGKISKDDLLQLKLEWVNSKKSLQEAEQRRVTSCAKLRSYLSYGRIDAPLVVKKPELVSGKNKVEVKRAFESALDSRPELTRVEKQQLLAQQKLARAKANNRFQADLQASIGLSRSAEKLETVYNDPQEEQNISLRFSIPIIDWGKGRSSVQVAKYEKEYMDAFVLNQEQVLQAEIIEVVTDYNKMLTTIELIEQAQGIAMERFEISKERFLMGNISTTEYTLSLRSKDEMLRTYTSAMRDYWYAHYRLRSATLFDFDKNEKIVFQGS